jgi:hypothetical protein
MGVGRSAHVVNTGGRSSTGGAVPTPAALVSRVEE